MTTSTEQASTTERAPTGPRRRARRAAAVALPAVLVLALGLAACGGDDDDDASSNDTANAAEGEGTAAGGDAYEITDISYTDVTASAGGSLAIANSSGAAHTFTADDGSFDVSIDADGEASVDVPAEPGAYPFHCEIHPSMQATLTAE
jgi:plastocyanin